MKLRGHIWTCCSCCSVTQSCPTLWDPSDCSMPGLPFLTLSQSLPRFMFIASVRSSSHLILWHPLLLLPSIFPSIRDFSNESSVSDDQNTVASASASVLPMNIQGWFPLRLIGSILSKGLSGVFYSTTVQRHQFFLVLPSLWSSSHNHNYHWEDHSLDYTDLCWQSNTSALQNTV